MVKVGYNSGAQIIEHMKSGQLHSSDAVFLDLEMPEIEKLAVRAETRDRTYAFEQDGIDHSLPLSDIIYFESRNHELNIYTAEKTYIQRQSIANAAAATEPYFFVRCHASFLVNCKHITAVKKSVVTLDNSIEIPVSRNKQKETEAAYMNYLRNTVQTI